MHEKAKDDDGIAPEATGLGAENAKDEAAGDLAHADHQARQSHVLLRVALGVQALRVAHHRAVDGAEEGQLDACVDEGEAQQKHLRRDQQLKRVPWGRKEIVSHVSTTTAMDNYSKN